MSDTEVIYARVPAALKEAAEAYATERGATLTGAVVDLIDRGLSAVSDEQSVAKLEKSLSEARAEKLRLEAELLASQTQIQTMSTLTQHVVRPVGTCPNSDCGKPISGYDLFGLGQCRQCGQGLSSLIVPSTGAPTIDQREVMFVVGALAAVLGIAYLASK